MFIDHQKMIGPYRIYQVYWDHLVRGVNVQLFNCTPMKEQFFTGWNPANWKNYSSDSNNDNPDYENDHDGIQNDMSSEIPGPWFSAIVATHDDWQLGNWFSLNIEQLGES